MATEAEIIPEPISLVKPEEESKHLTLELCDKVVKFLPGDLNKFQGELTRPAETGECLAKAENMPVASNNRVETMHTVCEGNHEISKGESFLISPEISKVANETRGMLEHTEVDDTPFKAEKTLEDEEKMANDKKFQLEEEAGTGENEVKEATEDGMEKGGTDHGIEELNLDIGGEKRMEVEVIVDQDSSLEEKGESIEEETSHSQESEHKGTMTDENADNIESDEQVLGIQQANLELKKKALIHTPDPTIESLKEANETVTEASNSNLQDELEEKSFKEVKDTESEKLPALVGKEEGTEVAILGREKDQITSDSIGDTLTSTLAESSEIKDHETTSEISEVAKKEPCNPYEEVACVHESTPKVDDKLEEVSSIIIKQEGIQKELEDCTAEKPELEDAMENISKQEETKELCEGPKSIIKEECAIIDETMKSTEEEMHRSFQEDVKNETPQVEVPEKLEINTVEDAEKQILEEEDTNKHQTTLLAETIEEKPKEENTSPMMSIKKKKEDDSKAESNFEVSTSATNKEESLEKENEKRKPEKELCKESETAASGTGKENPEMEEHPIADISNSSMSRETVKESIKDGQSSPMKLIEEASNSNIKETALQNLEETVEPNNDPSVLDIENESKEEITATEPKEDLVRRFSSELEESKKDTEEETSVKGIINTADLDSESPEAETEETNKKEAEAEEKKKERNNVLAAEENCMVTTEHEGIGIDGADIDVKPVDPSTSFEKEKEIPQVDGMQDKVPNAGSEDQMEMTTREIPLNEILGDEVKEYSTMPSEEHKLTPTVERKIIDETSEKDHTPDEHSESPVLQATDEILMVKEDNPTLDVPKAESEDTGKEGRHEVKEHLAKEPYVHTEQESGKSRSISGVTNVSNGEEPRELESESDACKEKTLQDKQSSDTGLERKKVEDGKPLDEATDVGKTSGTCHDSDKANREEENLANNLAKPESLEGDTEVEKEETELPGVAHDQIPEVINVNDNAKNVEPVVEDQSKETFPQPSKSQDDETSTDVQNQETEKQILEELKDKRDNEHYVNREQNANEVTKAVLLSEEVNKEVEKADDSEDIKQHVIDEESSTNELHLESKGDDTTNEVEEYASVSTVCLKEVDSNKQIEKSKSEVEEHSTKDREASVVIKESEEMRQDEESGDRVSMQGEEKESEEKIDDIVDGSKLCQDKSDIEAVTKVRAETSLNNTEVDKKLVSTSNISSETTESDANLETKELKLEEISSDLAPSVPTNDDDEVERQSLNVDIVDKDEAEVIKKDPDAVYLSEDQIDEAQKSLTVEKVNQLSNNDHELVETKSEASKTSNADELGKIELASDGGHFSEDNGFEQDAETKKSLTAEELEANEVEETKGEPETSSNYLPQKVETILEEDAISSHNTLTEEKLEVQLQTSTSTLPSEDEEIKTPNSTTKIEEEIQKDAGTVKHESLEDSSDTKTKEEVCLQKEEQRKPQAVSGEETVVNQGLQKEEPEKQIQTTSSTFPSQEMENAAGAISDEIDVVTGDGITGEHTLSANKPEEGTTSFALLSKEQEEETVSTVKKIDKKKIDEAEISGNKISEDSSDAKKTAEMCLDKEEFQGLEDATNDETAAQTIQVEEPKEQSLTSAMPSENIEHGTTDNEEEEEKVKGVEMLVKEINLEKEKPEKPEAVVDQETTVGQASITEESVKIETIGTIEKLDEDNKMKEAENLEDKICEDSSSSLQKEEPNELHTVPKERITSGQTFSEEQPDEQLHISTSAITSEEQEHETKKTEDKETNHEATIKDEISEDASDARTTEETCSQKERSIELAVEDAMTAGHTVTEKKSEEQAPNPTFTLPSKEVEGGNTSTTEKIESKKIEEAEFLQDDIGGDESLQKERFQEDEALAKDENASSQTLLIEEQISNLVATLPLEEHKHETVNEVDKTEEEKVKEKEMQHEDSDVAKKVVEICSEKYETRGAQAALEGETIASQVITQESEEKKTEEAETLKDDKSLQTECVSQGALEDGATAAHTLSGENQPDQLHSTISTLPSEEQKDETKETELLQDESPEKITKQTTEIKEASNVKMETPEKAIDNELLTESEDAARDETAGEENQCEKTNEGNEVILTEVSKEEVIEDKEVIETSYSTSHSGKLTKEGSAEDKPRDKLIEDLTNESLEATCQNDKLLVEAQKSTENDTIEKQIVCEDKTVEDPGQASVSGIETRTVTEEASSIELSLAEGTNYLAEGNQIIDDIQQPGERTNIASDKQIPKELDPIENTEITSSFDKEHAPIDLQERLAEPSRKAEVGDVKEIYPKQAEVDHGGETITDNSGEDITKESTTKVSSSNHIESSTKETLQVTQDTIEEREAKDENGAAQILSVEKPEEQSPAPSSKKPSDGVSPQVEAVEEKEVEILNKDSPDTKTGEEICLAKDENKKVKTVVEQETIAVKAPPSEIKEDPVSPFEDGRKENELKDEDTLKVQTYEIQNGELCVETLKDGANDNIEKEIVAEDETVKEATTVREEIPGEAYLIDSGMTASSINKEHFPTEQQDRALVTSDKAEVGDMEPGNAQEICSEVVVDHGDEQKKDNLGVQITQEPASVDSAKPSLSGLHQRSTREKMQVSEDMIEERELRVSKEEPHVEEAETIQAKEAKTEEKDEGEEGDDHNKRDSGSDAPVMVEAPRDTDTKPHKKSHNILSGVGSKVKHSISKVKKAITGKSSHSKESKPISPKGSEK